MKVLKLIFAGTSIVVLHPFVCLATWTPLVTSDNFIGVQTDVLTSGTGVLSIAVIVLGLGFIIRVMAGR